MVCAPAVVFDWLKFSQSWRRDGELAGTIGVRTERDAVVLSYRVRGLLDVEWKPIEQRVPITRTACHFGGRCVPWFICPVHIHGRYYGRRVALLYLAGEVFACRKCYGLAYASQQGGLQFRNLRQSQRIRTRLGAARTPASPYPTSPAACISERMSALRRWRNRLKRLRAGAAEQASNFLASSMNCVDCV